jgi:chemotaxis family two-component system sensor kinase Cph1
MSQRDDSSAVDMASCEREPIHIPGAIQPHGVLLVLAEPGFCVAQVSENSSVHLGVAAADVLGRPLAHVLEPASAAELEAALSDERGPEVNPSRVLAGGKPFDAILHRSGGAAVLELEPAPASTHASANQQLRLALKGVQHALTLPGLYESVVREVRRLTGFERVMLYRFDEDGHGSVDAEAKDPQLPAYLGLHYPASDIPRQARELYLKNWLRIIPDALYSPVRVVPTLRPDTGAPLDLSHSVLRSVSPVHLEYMANMGVRASMSISLIVRDRLWGLISCAHHTATRFIPYELRAACEVLGRLTSLQIAALEDQEGTRLRAARRSTQDHLRGALRENNTSQDVLATLLAHSAQAMALVGAGGAALVSGGEARTAGQSPPPEVVVQLGAWLDERAEHSPFSTASLPSIFPPAVAFKDTASGLLTFTLPGQPRRRWIWFRPEMVQTVNWGGDPRKPVELEPGARPHPRRSFELWKQEVGLRAVSWSANDLESGEELRRNIVEVDLERQVARERRAVQTRDDLVAVVSHDLKNPLGVIQMQAAVLLLSARSGDEEPSRRLRGSAERIQRAVDRMNALIHDLLDLAAIEAGRFILHCRPENVRDVVDESLMILRPLADGKHIAIREELGALPRVDLDRERLFQVLSNLIGNAVKFTPEGGTITIGTELAGEELLFTISDTGRGITAEQMPYIFDRYWQARNNQQQGSGLGLYIAKGIVEAHGGRIWVEAPSGGGATFRFTLSLRCEGSRPGTPE